MQKRSRTRPGSDYSPLPPHVDGGLVGLVDEILAVLSRRQPEPHEGVQALLVAFLHSASRTLDASSEENLEGNRAALLLMLEQARSLLAERAASPSRYTVH
jgi:hypothetical protein